MFLQNFKRLEELEKKIKNQNPKFEYVNDCGKIVRNMIIENNEKNEKPVKNQRNVFSSKSLIKGNMKNDSKNKIIDLPSVTPKNKSKGNIFEESIETRISGGKIKNPSFGSFSNDIKVVKEESKGFESVDKKVNNFTHNSKERNLSVDQQTINTVIFKEENVQEKEPLVKKEEIMSFDKKKPKEKKKVGCFCFFYN